MSRKPQPEDDRALARMLGICLVIGAAMWAGLFWLLL